MKKIWKFPLQPIGDQTVRMPAGACPLSVGVQYDEVFIWALVETDNAVAGQDLRVQVCVTGGPVNLPARFLGTVILRGGALVFHIFVEGVSTYAA